MIPKFPRFTNLSAFHAVKIRHLTRNLPEYSDFNLVSLLSWDLENNTMISDLDGNLVVLLLDYITGERVASIAGTSITDSTISNLIDYADINGIDTNLKYLPEEAGYNLSPSNFHIDYDKDNYDYMISTKEVSAYEGRAFKNFRRKISKFKSIYQESASMCELDITDESLQKELLQIFDTRESVKLDNDDENERQAIKNLFDIQHRFSVRAYGVRIDGVLVAFILLELTPNMETVGHFWRADTSYSGLYQFLLASASEQLYEEGYSTMNIEQDLGIEGLRKSKEQLNPQYLRKLTLSPALPLRKTAAESPVGQQLTLQIS